MKSPSKMGRWRQWLGKRRRGGLLGLAGVAWLALALISFEGSPSTGTRILLDVSASVGPRDPASLGLPGGIPVDVFARTLVPDVRGDGDRTEQWTGETDLETAVRSAIDGPNPPQRLWLLSDGRPTKGDLEAALAAARRAGIPIDVTPLSPAVPAAVRLERLDVPETAPPGSPIEVRTALRWSEGFRGEVSVVLLESIGTGWSQVGERRLLARGGGASVVFQRTAPSSGEVRFEARIASPVDPPPFDRDDSLRAVCRVDERQRVIWLYPSSRPPVSIPGTTERFAVESRAWPASEEYLARADVLVIADLRAEELEAAPLPLDELVAREGRGVLVLGGPRTLGPGGWAGRPIESWLPVRCTPPEEEGADLWLLVDRSGSMAGEPLDQARRAIRSVVRGAAPRDGVWAAGFAEDLEAPVRLKAPGEDLDVERVGAWLAGLEARGSTALVAALEQLESRLPSDTSRRRHVLVLSDGQATGEDPESRLPALGQRLGRDEVAVSVHAAGTDPDEDLLKRLVAAGAGGRYTAAEDIETLPELFLSEVRRDWIRTGPIAVRDRGGRSLPELDRLVRTDSRSEAEVELVSEDGDPVLATVRRGVGQVGVFTSGGDEGWADAWRSGELWDRLLTAVAPPAGAGWSVTWRRSYRGLELDVRSPAPIAQDPLRIRLDGAPPVALAQVAPSAWQGDIELPERRRSFALDILNPSGGVWIRKRIEPGGDEELIRLGPDMQQLERIARVTGGQVRPLELRESDLPDRAGPSRVWAIALAAAGILALLAARHRPRG